eukprot:Sspe_Gene.31593::Locus_15565_Transcript_1_1_Confidence_1.000_Length_2571::g.31593::m.31593/K01868/TARS, thrS; threonyl-tRNA synthetase
MEEYAKKEHPMKVKLLDGKEIDAVAWKTTPYDIARGLSNSLPDKVFVAKVNGNLWDLARPLETSEETGNVVTIEFLDWDSAEARKVFWHSSAHILGLAMEWLYEAKLSTGPPLEDGGFFYEADTREPVSEKDYSTLEACIKDVTSGKHPFQRLVISKENALKLFEYNPFKYATLKDKVPENGYCTVYKCGNLIDPCRGPHLPHTGRMKAYQVHKNSSSYWRNKDTNPLLQRVYGISFPDNKMLKEWQEMMAAAQENSHTNIGTRQNLWMFNEMSPGSCFWFPHGARLYNKLVELMRTEYRKRGFEEVITPNMYNSKLWTVSGHWQKYQNNMFIIHNEDKDPFGLKPMNCPGHCLMYASTRHSYKELPIRYADFGVLHRNELAGALHGLTRVRRFQQDDAHIFCLPEQTADEIKKALDFLDYIYDIFGFKFHLALSTRPENMLGTHEMWDKAEGYLQEALNQFCKIPEEMDDPFAPGKKFTFDGSEDAVKRLKRIIADWKKKNPDQEHEIVNIWTINPGDGAFYGPKIDIRIEDAMRRKHQLGTLQLDFNLPRNFDLVYDPGFVAEKDTVGDDVPTCPTGHVFEPSEKNAKVCKVCNGLSSKCITGDAAKKARAEVLKKRPVMIHRAILGSLERCIAILAEHWKGRWPFWISPRQLIVLPVSETFLDYGKQVKDAIFSAGFDCDLDTSDATLPKKVREAQVSQYNFMLIVGEKEKASGTVTVRRRSENTEENITVEKMIQWCKELTETKAKDF